MPEVYSSAYELHSLTFSNIQKAESWTGSCDDSDYTESYQWGSWGGINGSPQPMKFVTSGFVLPSSSGQGYHTLIDGGQSLGTRTFHCRTPDVVDHISGFAYCEYSTDGNSTGEWSIGLNGNLPMHEGISAWGEYFFASTGGMITDTFDFTGGNASTATGFTFTSANNVFTDSSNANGSWASTVYGWSGTVQAVFRHKTLYEESRPQRATHYRQLKSKEGKLVKGNPSAAGRKSSWEKGHRFSDGLWASAPINAFQTTVAVDTADVLFPHENPSAKVTAMTSRGEVVEIQYTNVGAGCEDGPPTFSAAGITATATAQLNLTSGVSGVTIVNSGVGYTMAPEMTFAGGGGSGASGIVSINASNGKVTGVSVTSQGSGYYAPPTPAITTPKAVASATASVSGGAVTSITVTSSGDGYTCAPEVILSGGGGSGAVLTAAINASGRVSSISVTEGGEGIWITPTITVAAADETPGWWMAQTATYGRISLVPKAGQGAGIRTPYNDPGRYAGGGSSARISLAPFGPSIDPGNLGGGFTDPPTLEFPEYGTVPPPAAPPYDPYSEGPILERTPETLTGPAGATTINETYPIPQTPIPFPEPWDPGGPGVGGNMIVEICDTGYMSWYNSAGTYVNNLRQFACYSPSARDSANGNRVQPLLGDYVKFQLLFPEGMISAKPAPTVCGVVTGTTSSSPEAVIQLVYTGCADCSGYHGDPSSPNTPPNTPFPPFTNPPPPPGSSNPNPTFVKSYTSNFHGRWPTRQYLHQPVGVAPHGDKNRKYELRGLGDGGTHEVYGAKKAGRGLSFSWCLTELFMTTFKYRAYTDTAYGAYSEAKERISKDLGFQNSYQGSESSWKIMPPSGPGQGWVVADYQNFAEASEAQLKDFLQKFNVINDDIPTTDFSFIRLIGMVSYKRDGINRSLLDENNKQYCLVYCNKSVPPSVNVIQSLAGGYIVLTSSDKFWSRYITEMTKNVY